MLSRHVVIWLVILTFSLTAMGCGSEPPATQGDTTTPDRTTQTTTPAAAPAQATTATTAPADSHSFANVDEAIVTHLDWNVDINFDDKTIRGVATLRFDQLDPAATELVLDTRDLTIFKAWSTADDESLEFRLMPGRGALGSALHIPLPKNGNQIAVEYQTSPAASGVQWLSPEQTDGKQHPFLFTQAQAIHARSFIPLQDTPRARLTYTATVRTPTALRAVMSAANDPDAPKDGEFEFNMPQAIPSYLIAIGVGDLEFQGMSERTGVYAEPALLEAAAKEFEDTEAMMVASEALFGPYRWGRYDLLILPPSFPFGGMENPRLSFITPTVIAGDKSLVGLIAHELAHSWSGNLVTNSNWNDLWLNEGFTVYLESRIMEVVFDQRRRRMEAVLGYQDLQENFADLPAADQRLVLELGERDPDDAFSNVPYEKGRLLLDWLENRFGRTVFDQFLRQYFDEFAFKSMHTDQFVAYLEAHLFDKNPGKATRAELDAWLHQPGVPDHAVLATSDAFDKIDAARSGWLTAGNAASMNTEQWTVHEWLYFLNNLPPTLSSEQLAELDTAFALTASSNNEIAHSWLLIAIRNGYEPALPRLREYLVGIGRRKLIVPLYRELMNHEWGQTLARETYAKARPGYHPLAQGTVDAIVIPAATND